MDNEYKLSNFLKIQKYEYEFEVYVYEISGFYSIYIYIKTKTDLNSLRNHCETVAKIEVISDVIKDKIMSRLDSIIEEYLSSRVKLHEILESQIVYDGLNSKPKCTCCEFGLEFYHSKC